jgi:hypothetical protein
MRKDCVKDCGEIAAERMRYFPGRFMSARDFTDEQDYFLTHRYLHNRILHGWGVACGLHVYTHPVESCRKDHVKVDCGMALDCCGREIVVRKAVVPPPIPWSLRPVAVDPAPTPAPVSPSVQAATASHETDADAELAVDPRWYPMLCLEYCETEIERVPVLYSERNCDEQRREFSRIAEEYKFTWHWVRFADLPKYRWKVHAGGCPERRQLPDGSLSPCPDDDCHDHHDGPRRCCLEVDCPPDYCVPIAWIHADGEGPVTADRIITLGRPALEPPVESLTHICSINWPHGGTVSRRYVEHHLKRLEIRFDRRLKKSRAELGSSGPRGVNPCTFMVQFGGGYEDLDFVTYTEPPHVEHDCIAVFTIDPRSLRHHREPPYAYLENQTIFITLKCDFILDCHSVAVDGDHLGGILPSGNGVAGGTFESWFRVVPDHEWERRERERPEDEERLQ